MVGIDFWHTSDLTFQMSSIESSALIVFGLFSARGLIFLSISFIYFALNKSKIGHVSVGLV